MPFKKALWWIAATLILTVAAFWRGYLSNFGDASWQVHFHALTAAGWMALLAFQTWSIQNGARDAHRTTGLLVLVLTPLFLGAAFATFGTFSTSTNIFAKMYGAKLTLVDLTAAVMLVVFVHQALRHRRQVRLHAGYMLSTLFLLSMPILSRLFPGFVPGLTIRGLDDMGLFAGSVHLAHAVGLAIAVTLYLQNRKQGQPFLIAAVWFVAQSLLFEFVAETETWISLYHGFASVSPAVLVSSGVVIGGAAVYAGWRAGASASRQ